MSNLRLAPLEYSLILGLEGLVLLGPGVGTRVTGADVGLSVTGDGADKRCGDWVMHSYPQCQSPHLFAHPGNISHPVDQLGGIQALACHPIPTQPPSPNPMTMTIISAEFYQNLSEIFYHWEIVH